MKRAFFLEIKQHPVKEKVALPEKKIIVFSSK